MVRAGKNRLDIKPPILGGIVAGGIAFGTGMAVTGYCPGTGLAALGEGRRDALAATLGMLFGARLFVRAYAKLKPMIEAGDFGKVTLYQLGSAAS